jgi:putative phage-type endonuclease
MKIYEDLIQGSPEWLEFRRMHVGASDAATIMGMNPWHTKLQLWQEKCLGWTKEVNNAMRRGTEMEEQARNAYILQTGRLVLPMVATCEVHPFISASFDGVSDDFKNIVEIKCGKASHKLAQHGELPRYYMAQVQQQMYVAGVQEMDYFSYNQIIKPDHSFVEDKIIIPVTLDYEFVETLIEKIKEFWHCVQTNTPPKD